jgi:serine/threonine-protein kinase HipA
MTRRFDRLPDGGKLHMQSLGALAHLDYNQPGAHAYEQAMLVIQRLGLPPESVDQMFRRMAFNIVARNQDDHVKNVAFLMDRRGAWALGPAFDVIYSYNPSGPWTAAHQMTMNGKRDGFAMSDFRACGRSALLTRGRADAIVDQVREAVARWPEFADQARVPEASRDVISRHLRLSFPKT